MRTKKGIIGKVYVIDSIFAYLDREVKYIEETESSIDYVFKTDITKHSFDIIDLIEKDDYINGCRVYKVEEQGVTTYQQTECSDIDYNWIHKSEIKDIVTKEQFNSIKYEVK